MDAFQQRVEAELRELFPETAENSRLIERIGERANELRAELEQSGCEDFDLTAELVADKLRERVDGGPMWAWNNWIGTLESFDLVPGGYQL